MTDHGPEATADEGVAERSRAGCLAAARGPSPDDDRHARRAAARCAAPRRRPAGPPEGGRSREDPFWARSASSNAAPGGSGRIGTEAARRWWLAHGEGPPGELERRWAEARGNFFAICTAIDDADHFRLLEGSANKKGLRPADIFMMKTTVKQRAWPCPDNLDAEQWERNMNK